MTATLGTDLRHPVITGLAEMSALLGAVAAEPMWTMAAAELGKAVVEADAVLAQAAGVLCRLVGEVDALGLANVEGAGSTEAWLRGKTLAAVAEASRTVAVGRLTRDGASCAVTGVELGAGSITLSQAAAISHAVAALPVEVGPALRREAEAHLLNEAAYFDAVALTRLGRTVLEVIAPDVAEARLGEQLAETEERDRRLREIRIIPDGHGRHYLSGWLDALGAATLHTALDPLCKPCPGPDGEPDPRSAGTRSADALVEVCRRMLDSGDLPETGADKPHLTVTMSWQLLIDEIWHATFDTGDPLSPELARTLACDAAVIPAVLNGAGYPMDVGRSQRTFTGPLRRAVILRDTGCVFPGCDRPPSWCEVHHIIHWIDGGHTARNNGALLCGRHHSTIHKGDWVIRLATDGHPEFIPPQWLDADQKPRRNRRMRRPPD